MTAGRFPAIARRLALMVGGEAMQSGFHFALNIALIRLLPTESYGIFAIIMVIGGLGLTYIRALTAMPAIVWIGRSRTAGAANAYEVTFGSGALVLSAAMAIGVAVLLHVWLGRDALAGGAFVGAWALRSHLRLAVFARGAAKIASLSDLGFTLSGCALAGAALAVTAAPLTGILIALGAANAVGIALLLALPRRPVRISLGKPVRRRFLALMHPLGWSALSVTLANLQGQGVALLVAAIAGPAAYAPIAAALVLFVPLRVGASALVNMIQPEVAAMLARGEYADIWRRSGVWTIVVGLIGVVYGALVMAMMPLIGGAASQGQSFWLIGICAWIVYTMTMLYVMPRIVLEAMSAFKAIAVLTGIGALVGLAGIRVVLAVAPPAWALAGGAISEIVVLAGSWLMMARLLPSPGMRRPVGRRSGDALRRLGAGVVGLAGRR